MLASCVFAYLFPFELFLFSYAILGPLHYLTEISWLHDRGYFIRTKAATGPRFDRAWLALVGVTLTVMMIGVVGEKVLHRDVPPVWEIGLFYLVFLTASVAAIARSVKRALLVAGVGAVALAVFSRSPLFALLAFFLITIIHVFVFTGAFILMGALKTRSASALLSLAVFVLCAASFFVYVPAGAALPGDYVRTSYESFQTLNAQLIRLFHLGPGTTTAEIYMSTGGLVVMRLIAFAYTYHYLNWFSKTSVIRWHEISKPRAALIAVLWIAALVPFAFSYVLGFVVLYMLSVLHVMLEFPLNHHSFVGIASELRSLIRPKARPRSQTA